MVGCFMKVTRGKGKALIGAGMLIRGPRDVWCCTHTRVLRPSRQVGLPHSTSLRN